MSYCVTEEHNNGYRCGCCHQSWEADNVWFDDEQEALDRVRYCKDTKNFDWETENITVVDGSTSEKIAWGKLDWTGATKGDYYHYWRWHGEIKGVPFEEIHGNNEGESWGDMATRLQTEKRLKDIKTKEAEIARLKTEVEQLTNKEIK